MACTREETVQLQWDNNGTLKLQAMGDRWENQMELIFRVIWGRATN